MIANKPMTGEQLDELMTVAVNMQRDSEKAGDRPSAMFAYAVQVAVLELRKVRNHAAKIPETSMSIARYWISPNGIACEDNEGKFVRYEDYAALEARCVALAAASAEVKELIEQHANSVAVCPNCSHEEPSETDDIVALYRSMETPATDAFLAEVRASAIDSLVDIKTKQLADMHPDTHAFGATAMSIRSQINELQIFAAQLRKGVQS